MLLSILIVASVGFGLYIRFHPREVPLQAAFMDAHVAVFHPFAGFPLPAGIEDGDRADLRQQSLDTRILWTLPTRPLGETVDLVVQHGKETRIAKVGAVDTSGLPGILWFILSWSCSAVLVAAIALLLVWRGRDRAAFGMGLWASAYVFSAQWGQVPLGGLLGFGIFSLSVLCFLTARVGFYIMVETRVREALSPAQRLGFSLCFWSLMVLGTIYGLVGPVLEAFFGWAGLINNDYGLVLTASYGVPVVMLYVGYLRAAAAERQRLRWMLTSGILWVLGILLINTPVLGVASGVISSFLLISALAGFLYAVLRLRVVDVSVFIDRALVYGGMTTLVVGVMAALNSLALRETLVPGAGFALQVLVPLSLGIVLGKVRSYLDRIVERVFFRKKYLAERALRTFARRVGHMEDTSALLDAAATEIRKRVDTPGLAIYSAESGGYRRVRLAGEATFPESLVNDDAAFVALRADRKAVDLGTVTSGLGEDGCVFPMLVLGNLRGAVVCRNRPGEHFAADEKKLLTQVSREVGAAWRILRARDNEALVEALAAGKEPAEALREKARALSWAGA